MHPHRGDGLADHGIFSLLAYLALIRGLADREQAAKTIFIPNRFFSQDGWDKNRTF
jgi:hypothetical protein